MGQLRFDTVNKTITLEHSRQDLTLGHSKCDIYVKTQGHMSWDSKKERSVQLVLL